jgi:addiction module RelE/StbE family toxin
MIEVKFASGVEESLIKIKRKNSKLFSRIDKQLALFVENPKHPSLRTHKLSGKMKNMLSISITVNIRMVYVKISDNSFIFVKIVTHKEVYK